MGWFGPRGIGTLVLGLLVIDRGEIQQGALIRQVVVVTVTMSLILYSLTAPLGIRLCAQGATAAADTGSPPPANDVVSEATAPHRKPGENEGNARL